MKNTAEVCEIKCEGKRIEYKCKFSGEWSAAFLSETDLYVEYDREIKDIPEAVAVLPLVANLLPVSWLLNGEIIVNEIDYEFYSCIEKVKQGYINMQPAFNLRGNLIAKKIVRSKYEQRQAMAMFSGGVDALSTLITHIEEKPILATVWGADIGIEDLPGWKNVINNVSAIATQFDLDYTWVKSNFRLLISEKYMHEYTMRVGNVGWWHDFHHMLGMTGLMAPMLYYLGCEKLYLASSFCEEDKGKYTCASDPTIDNFVRYGGCAIFHDGYENNRQDKINIIADYSMKTNTSFPIHVCWENPGGKNCCWCEKCMRTIVELIAAGVNPTEFGFDYSDLKTEMKHLRRITPEIPEMHIVFYEQSQRELRKRYDPASCPKELRWFYSVNMRGKKYKVEVFFRGVYHKLKRFLNR